MFRLSEIPSMRLAAVSAIALMATAFSAELVAAKPRLSNGSEPRSESVMRKAEAEQSPADREGEGSRKEEGSEEGGEESARSDDTPDEEKNADETANAPQPTLDKEKSAGAPAPVIPVPSIAGNDKPFVAPRPVTKKADTGPITPAPKDYYGKRAESIIKTEDGAVHAPPHPLAAAHPGMDVVVCEGGCNEVPAEIVYMQPTTFKPKTAEEKAAEKAGKSLTNTRDIVCVGGCYDTPRQYAGADPRGMVASPLGEWMTTVTPTSATPVKPGGSGEWMRKIDDTRVPEPQTQK